MRGLKQFITYKPVLDEATGKWDKLPTDPATGDVIDAQDSRYWVSYAAAVASKRPVGFVLTDADPYFCIDIDGCYDAASRSWDADALKVVAAFPGAMVEVSMSGKGLHIWGRYSGPIPDHGCKNVQLGLELYHTKRFIALGQPGAKGDPDTDCTKALDAAIFTWFPPSEFGVGDDWTTEPAPEWAGPTDDDDLIARALRSGSAASAFSQRATFRDLWEANAEVLAVAYPSKSGQAYDASSADMALASHLAFWTGRNCERIRRLMDRSALKRDKWEREEYIQTTILKMASGAREVYKARPAEAAVAPVIAEGAEAASDGAVPLGMCWPEQQAVLFKGCVYVQDVHQVFVPGEGLLKPEQFKVRFGGRSFPIDRGNTKVSKDAWEAFTQSQVVVYPKARTTCFRPDLPPSEIVMSNGKPMVNTWIPVPTARREGDPTRFLNHLAKVLPDHDDQDILLAYMAALVQYPGVKFKWAPFIQGTPGNGKTLFSECVAECVGREYCHTPKAADIASKFNGWMYRKLFVAVEDIYVPEKREDVMEALKPMITAEWLEVEAKGENQVTREMCANFIINSNHKSGIRKTRDDRRFAPFFSAQQNREDVIRDGMGGSYFPDLYKWLRKEGYAIVNNFLRQYAIPDALNPARNCHIAPFTSSTKAAIEAGLGRIEQEVLEMIDQCVPGFCGGWINSRALNDLLVRLRADHVLPPNKRRDMLKGLGYDWHKGLNNGRVNNPLPDGSKPTLFIKADHWAADIKGAAAIVKAYQDAQAGTGPQGVPAAEVFGRADE